MRSDAEAVLHELEDLTYIQGELSADNILLRGGVAAGLAYSDHSGVFGPALIDAFTLERKCAQYPRIVLHPDLLTRHATSGKRGREVYAKDGLPLTLSADDGFHFIDYLGNFPREVHSDPSPDREEIARSYMVPRKQHVEATIAKADVLSTVRTKYVWLAHYHNQVATDILGAAASDVLIDF